MSHPASLKQSLPGLWRMLRGFWPYIRKQRRLIAGSLVALFSGAGLRLLEPWPLAFVFDYVIPRAIPTTGRTGMTGLAPIDALHPVVLLTLAAAAVAAFAALRATAEYSNTVGFALIGNRVMREVRNKVYRHLHELSLAFHHKSRGGDLNLHVIRDVSIIRDVASTALLPFLASGLVLVGMWGFMFTLNWRLALVALATAPLFGLSTVRITRRIREKARQQRQREGAMAATAAESLAAIKIVQAFSLLDRFAEAFAARALNSQETDLKGSRLSARLARTVDLLVALATAIVLWYGARLVLTGELTVGILIVFLAYLKNAFRPVQDFTKYTARLAKASAAGERVLDLLELTPDVRDLPGAVPAPRFQGAVRFEDVTFAYENGFPVLDRIDFAVEPGQHVALVGPSGIGKSTLVSLIQRLYDPVAGRVLIDGRDIRDYTLLSLRSQTSVVLQDSMLFHVSVAENIGYGALGSTTREEIEAAARLARAHDFILAMPHGYDTVVGERGVTLSGGERQRIAIARAAIRKAPILILDEPTTGLDEENERAVIETLDQVSVGRTTFVITHDLQVASRSDSILYLEGGQVRERGTHAELMQAGGRYAALYQLQGASHHPRAQARAQVSPVLSHEV